MIKDMEGLYGHLIAEIQNLASTTVLGLSGGIDSAVVAALCHRALGPKNVHTIFMPITQKYRKSPGNRIRNFVEHCIPDVNHEEVEIEDTIAEIVGAIENAIGKGTTRVNRGNAVSRVITNILYGYAHHMTTSTGKSVRIVGCANFLEVFIGYMTKGGDSVADFFPIRDLLKSEVYELAEFMRQKQEGPASLAWASIISAKPTPGLWGTHTYEDELGYSAEEIDTAIQLLLKKEKNPPKKMQKAIAFVKNRHEANNHKFEVPTTIHLRQFCE